MKTRLYSTRLLTVSKRMLCLLSVAFCWTTGLRAADSGLIEPSGTFLYAQKDTSNLYLDWYKAAEGSQTTLDGKQKPAVIFVFGGGFVGGTRDDNGYKPWFRQLTESGYQVFSIDYRLGLKGVKSVGLGSVKAIDRAIHMGVEDLFSATNFIISKADEFGIQPDNLVVSGSSAGAIISLQAEYEIGNGTSWTEVLPEGFNYAGVISFAGAVLSHKGKIKCEKIKPCPVLFLHGTADKVVNYKQIKIFKLGLFGSDKLAERFEKFGWNYNIIRYKDHQHDIADRTFETWKEQERFLEANVIRGKHRIVDALVDDPDVPAGGTVSSRKALYN